MLQNVIFFSQNELNKESPTVYVTNYLNLPGFEQKVQKKRRRVRFGEENIGTVSKRIKVGQQLMGL